MVLSNLEIFDIKLVAWSGRRTSPPNPKPSALWLRFVLLYNLWEIRKKKLEEKRESERENA